MHRLCPAPILQLQQQAAEPLTDRMETIGSLLMYQMSLKSNVSICLTGLTHQAG
jgi:hypothetical protein